MTVSEPDRSASGPPALPAPGRWAFGPLVAGADRWADLQLEKLRGSPLPDAVFAGATALGDFSLIWHMVNVARGMTSDERARQVPVVALAIGAESLIVNQGLKRLFRRPRPTVEGDPRFPVRRPQTSSFPSGHASAAAFMAVLLTGWDGRRWAPALWGGAAIVATSRAYVRIHHPSDVVAGMAVGAALGLGARRIIGRLGIR